MTNANASFTRLLATNLISSLICSIVAFGVLEAFCRVKLDDGMRYEFEMWRYATALKVVSGNPEISFVHRPNSRARIMGADVAINAQGLRDDRSIPSEKPAGTTRIVMLGDSVTLGFGVPLEQTTARLLEGALNTHDSHRRIEVINTGVGNYNTSMEVAYFLAEGRRFNPDIVILNFFVNDAEPTPRPSGNALTRHSLAAVYLSNRFDSASRWAHGAPGWQQYYDDLYQDDRPAWRKAQAAIADLKQACDRQGASLLLVNYPDLHQTKDYPLTAINAKVKALAERLGIPYLDLLAAVGEETNPQRLWVHSSDPHPNGIATARYAQMIGDWLVAGAVARR
jgi:lysophospholipase L1-like esterase